jgi:hypothetical protein
MKPEYPHQLPKKDAQANLDIAHIDYIEFIVHNLMHFSREIFAIVRMCVKLKRNYMCAKKRERERV